LHLRGIVPSEAHGEAARDDERRSDISRLDLVLRQVWV
jgi:hypothetical protein